MKVCCIEGKQGTLLLIINASLKEKMYGRNLINLLSILPDGYESMYCKQRLLRRTWQ